MSFYAFRPLSPVVQLYWVLKHGNFLVNYCACADEDQTLFYWATGRSF